MLNLINKFAAFLAIGVIGYLIYSASGQPASNLADKKEKDSLEVTKKMLYPVFIKPQSHSSGINRDPFEAGNDGYDGGQSIDYISSGSDEMKSSGELRGIIMDENGRKMALIGDKVYSVGSKVSLPDSEELWQIDSIDKESVVLGCNGQIKVLRIINTQPDFKDLDLNPQIKQQEKEQAE